MCTEDNTPNNLAETGIIIDRVFGNSQGGSSENITDDYLNSFDDLKSVDFVEYVKDKLKNIKLNLEIIDGRYKKLVNCESVSKQKIIDGINLNENLTSDDKSLTIDLLEKMSENKIKKMTDDMISSKKNYMCEFYKYSEIIKSLEDNYEI